MRACVRVGVWAIGACPRGDGARVAWVPPYGYERITAVPNNKIARVNLQKKNCHDFWPRMHFFRLFGLEPAAVTLNQIVLVSNTSPCHTHIHMRAPTRRAAARSRGGAQPSCTQPSCTQPAHPTFKRQIVRMHGERSRPVVSSEHGEFGASEGRAHHIR